jgi:hypothetical protein
MNSFLNSRALMINGSKKEQPFSRDNNTGQDFCSYILHTKQLRIYCIV